MDGEANQVFKQGASFSPCRRWRYRLWRIWDEAKPSANFVMLNPSTADENVLDPTCTRCMKFAMKWGYGALIVTNLFAWRATDPKVMKAAADPIGPENDWHIFEAASVAGIIIAAWGEHGKYLGRAAHVCKMLDGCGLQLQALKVNAGGQPAHPLYLPQSLEPQAYLHP